MIVLIMLVYGAFFQGIAVPMGAFIGAAFFDLALASYIFPQQSDSE